MNHFTAEDTFIIVGIVIAYILFTTWLTFRIRSKNSGDFMEGSRAMPAFIVGILLMSEYIGAKSTIGTAQAAFESGIAASWSVLGAAIGFPLFGLILVKRIYNTGKITISGAIAEKYGNSTKNIISLIMIYALLLVNVGNYVSGAAAISTVLKVNLPVAAFITAIVSTFYFAFGGMKGVAWVTMLHSALKYAGLLIILGFALSKTGGFSPMMEKMPDYYWTWDGNIGAGTIFAWLIGTIGSIFCTQFVIQAISSTKDVRSAKRSTWIAFFFCLPIAFAIAIIGVAAKYLLVPEVLKLSFFTRAIRLSITVVAVIAFYAPFFRSTRGANAGLIGACVVTSVWYLLGDPFGINNMYVALATPAIIMVIDRLIPNKSQPSPAPVEQRGV
ncbi:Na+/solute symporter [Klebsiella pneumoniae]|uniref:sodium:solute symporter family protein n=1 Tax=Klebsiella pneumoniae TaxID=573 RepID=UPI000DE6B204|nr:sodium:solute symporter family protein [Klebsiella pneumoniae]SSJ50585.1 Na+/solute symporter [Klebsiella pneumoniae]HBQ6913531.1 sodium:solute symporter family protein [Klebsiella pneumoniae]HBY3850036.1 sodium:solute symporter family protein [Klebsiella pneumoniae]